MALYKGFSTVAGAINTQLNDIELVKQDLRNHLSIQKGEVRGVPRFGTRIYDMIGQPMNDYTKNIVKNDVQAVINYDPRVEMRSFEMDSDVHSITIRARLYYIELDMEDLFEFFLNENDIN